MRPLDARLAAAHPSVRRGALDRFAPVEGGFVGTETSLQQRQGSAAQTILSGDALADSQPGAVSTLVDDSYHVVTVPANDPLDPTLTVSNWVLDSFTVEFGNANVWTPGSSATGWPANRYDGGGIYFDSVPNLPPSSSAGSYDWVVRNVTVQNCRAIGRGAGDTEPRSLSYSSTN